MVTTALVDDKIAAGEELLHRLDDDRFPIVAALWLYLPDPDEWRLMIASKLVDSEGPKAAYVRIDEVIRDTLKEKPLSLHDISVLSPKDSLVMALRRAIRTGAVIAGIRLIRNVINGVYVDDAYIYRIE